MADALIPKLYQHKNGQWTLKSNGKSLGFGADIKQAIRRAVIYKRTGIKAARHRLLDFAKQYVAKVGFDTYDEAYIAAWTARGIGEFELVENYEEWFELQEEFKQKCGKDRVYLISDFQGDVKIGFTDNIGRRLRSFQTAHKHKLELLCSLPGGKWHEEALHREFREFRLHGEWFRKCDPIDSLVDLASAIYPSMRQAEHLQ